MSESEATRNPPLLGEVMDVAGVAAYLGFSTSTIYDKVQTKDIPHVRLGNSLRFPKVVIDRWLEENTTQPQPSFYGQFVKMASRFFFTKWLESRGVDPLKADVSQLEDLVRAAHQDLQDSGREGFDVSL